MTTAADLINLALRDAGVLGIGQVAAAQDLTDGLARLNMMMAQWNRRRWLVYHLVDTSAASTGAASYTLGNAQTFNIARIDRLDAAYVTKSVTGVVTSTPMRMIQSREEFDRIALMAETGPPQYCFYDSGFPYGAVYFHPIPDNTYTLHVVTKEVLQTFATTATVVALPPEYEDAIYSNLVMRYRAAYRLPPDPEFDKLSTESLATLQAANLQDSQLRMPKVQGRSIGDLINLALEDSGVFGLQQDGSMRLPSYQDTQDALWRLNMMLAQWNSRRWLIYHLIDNALDCTGAQSYTVGAGGDFDIPRPDRIEAAYIRQTISSNPNQVDWPLQILQSMEDYSRIALKSLQASPPNWIFYDSGYPLGRVFPYTIPSNQYELHILTKAVLERVDSIEDVMVIPPVYEQAIYSNLSVQASVAAGRAANPDMKSMAKASLNTIRQANTQVARLTMPGALTRGPSYNIWSDRGY